MGPPGPRRPERLGQALPLTLDSDISGTVTALGVGVGVAKGFG